MIMMLKIPLKNLLKKVNDNHSHSNRLNLTISGHLLKFSANVDSREGGDGVTINAGGESKAS